MSLIVIAKMLLQLASSFMRMRERGELKKAGADENEILHIRESNKRLKAEIAFMDEASRSSSLTAFVRVRDNPDHVFASLGDAVPKV
jgi:hypothetical protein